MKGDPRRSNYDLPQDLAEVAVEVQAEAKARDKESISIRFRSCFQQINSRVVSQTKIIIMVVKTFTTSLQYFHDFFYLTPYFAASFPLLQELIVLDLDLEFRCRIDYSDKY